MAREVGHDRGGDQPADVPAGVEQPRCRHGIGAGDMHDRRPEGAFVELDAREAQRERGDREVGVRRVHRHELEEARGRERHEGQDPEARAHAVALAEEARERAAHSCADGGRERRRARQPSALEHGEVPLLHEIEEAPVGEQVEHVVHAHVRDRERQHVAILHELPHAGPGNRRVRARRRLGPELGELLGGHRRVLGGAVPAVPCPPRNEHERRQRRPGERPLPVEGGHEPGDQGRREGGSEAEAHALQALHQSPPIGREPGLEHSRGNGEDRPLGCAEEELRREQHSKERLALEEERCDRGRHAGGKADEPDEDEHPARPETLADHPARELHRGVTDEERGLEPADMHLSETEIRHHPVAGHRDASLLHVGDEAEAEKEEKYLPANADALRGGRGRCRGRRAPHESTESPIRSRT